MTALRLALPSKGRLLDDTLAYFRAAGLTIRKVGNARAYAAAASGIAGIEVAFMQAGEIPGALGTGAVHLGVTGEDLIRETLPEGPDRTVLVRALGYGRADLVVAVPQSWIDVETLSDLDDAAAAFRSRHGFPMRVATKYLNLTRRYFREAGLANYRLAPSDGATEGAPAAGAAEIVVDITSTGETLRANHLKIVGAPILRSEAQLRASIAAVWTDRTLETLRAVIERVEAREAARERVVLRCDLPGIDRADLDAALATTGASLVTLEGNALAAEAAKPDAYATAMALRDLGASRVESTAPDMLYGTGSDVFERVRSALLRNGKEPPPKEAALSL